METSVLANSNYNYYPNTMIALCDASYLFMSQIPSAVAKLGLRVVWGPAQLVDDLGVSYSLMYVARNVATDEYTVVIRGTNAISLYTWLDQDFDVITTMPFRDFVPSAPANAALSAGAYNGLTDLLSLLDPNTNVSLVKYLTIVKPRHLYVTGHSLGGTLVTPLYAYLNYALYGGGRPFNMALWSFAALTPGNTGFANYINSLGNPQFPFRIHNPLDIAPFFFYSWGNVSTVYNAYGLPWLSLNYLLRDAIDALFLVASPNGYVHPSGDAQLPAVFNRSLMDWAEQMIYQHHSTTYIALVKQLYPIVLENAVLPE